MWVDLDFRLSFHICTWTDGGTRYLAACPKRLMNQIDKTHDSGVRRGSFEINEGLLTLRVSDGAE